MSRLMTRLMTRRKLSLVVALAAAAALVVGVAACGGDDDDDGGGETTTAAEDTTTDAAAAEDNEIIYSLGFVPNYVQAFFFNALDLGFYEDAGLEVDFVVPESTETALQLAGAGRVQAGEYIGTDPIAAVGAGIPIVVPLTMSWGGLGLIANPDGPVQTVGDIDGTTAGIFSGLVYDEVCRPLFFEENGIDTDSVQTEDTGFSSVPPLLTEQVETSEAGWPFETDIYANEAGEEAIFFPYSVNITDVGVARLEGTPVCPPLFQGTFISTDWAAENPETAQKFIDATLEGIKFYAEDPVATRDNFIERFPDLDDPQFYYDDVAETLCGPDAATLGIGYNDREQWDEMLQLTLDGGEIDEPLTFEDVITDQYLPEEPLLASTCE